MTHPDHSLTSPPAKDAAAEVSIRIGTGFSVDARTTSAGLLSIGALVSGILLSTAVIVFVAERGRSKRIEAAIPAADSGDV